MTENVNVAQLESRIRVALRMPWLYSTDELARMVLAARKVGA